MALTPCSVWGPDRVRFMEHLTVADVAGLPQRSGRLSVITTESGMFVMGQIVVS